MVKMIEINQNIKHILYTSKYKPCILHFVQNNYDKNGLIFF